MDRLVLTLLLVSVTAIWGWTFPMVKEATAAYCVVGFLAIRFTIGSASLGIVAVRRINRGSFVVGGLIGIVLAAGYLLQTLGLRYTTPTNCGLITGLFALFGPLGNRVLFGVRTTPFFWFAAALSLVGLFLLTGAGPSPLNLGDLLTLGCAACFGLQIALLDRFAKHHDPIALTFAQLVSATFLFLLAWPSAEPVAWPKGDVWTALLITGVLATAVGFFIQVFAQRRIPAVRTAIILSLEPVFATIFGYLLAGDRLTPIQWAGAALMFCAVLASEVFAARQGETSIC